MPSRQTKSSTPRLSEFARHVVVPKGAVTTGWPAVVAKCADLAIRFRPWQPSVGRVILAKRADGKYAATIGGTGLSIPRQVGKTFLVGAIVFALCLLRPNLTVIWTSHRLRTAEETFGKMQAFAKRRKIKPHVAKVVLGSGEEEIRFHNGSRILFGARERGFGRGFDEVDVLIFDEAQILTDSALDDMIPATNQSRQETGALLLFMGTPPKPTDPGEVFTRMRTEALSGEDDDTGWIEMGADPGFEPTPLPEPLTAKDWEQVAKANPSFPTDTPRESILRMRKKLGPDSFRREGLGIWDAVQVGGTLDAATWGRLMADPAPFKRPLAWGIDLDEAGVATIAVVWRRPDKTVNAQLVSRTDGDVTDVLFTPLQLAPRVKELRGRYGGKVWAGGGAAALVEDANVVSGPDFAAACARVADLVETGTLFHCGQPELNDAVAAARWRTVGATGQRAWKLKDAPGIGPLAALTRAVHGLLAVPADPPPAPVLVKASAVTSDVDRLDF